jgi:hypothetical protein
MCVLTQQTTQMCLICGVLRSRFLHSSKPVYSARSVDNVCGPQKDSLKQIMCFIRKPITMIGKYFRIPSKCKRLHEVLAFWEMLICFDFFFAFRLYFIFCFTDDVLLLFFFLSYIRFRDILFYFPSGCQFVGEIVLWRDDSAVVLLVSSCYVMLCCVQYI